MGADASTLSRSHDGGPRVVALVDRQANEPWWAGHNRRKHCFSRPHGQLDIATASKSLEEGAARIEAGRVAVLEVYSTCAESGVLEIGGQRYRAADVCNALLDEQTRGLEFCHDPAIANSPYLWFRAPCLGEDRAFLTEVARRLRVRVYGHDSPLVGQCGGATPACHPGLLVATPNGDCWSLGEPYSVTAPENPVKVPACPSVTGLVVPHHSVSARDDRSVSSYVSDWTLLSGGYVQEHARELASLYSSQSSVLSESTGAAPLSGVGQILLADVLIVDVDDDDVAGVKGHVTFEDLGHDMSYDSDDSECPLMSETTEW